MITSKSLFHTNFVAVFKEEGFAVPDNSQFNSLYQGKDAEGARFIDDPVARTKMLTLPAVNLRIILEGTRLRLEDESGNEPNKSRLAADAANVCNKLFPNRQVLGFGFNMDLYFRFNKVLEIKNYFDYFFKEEVLKKYDLRDFGFQFTLDRSSKEIVDIWFLKITSPLELAVHTNRHFNLVQLPDHQNLQKLLETCYNEADFVVESLKF
jgi:hypothetical protein